MNDFSTNKFSQDLGRLKNAENVDDLESIYKKLMAEYHPDKFESKGEMEREIAKNRLSEILDEYNKKKKSLKIEAASPPKGSRKTNGLQSQTILQKIGKGIIDAGDYYNNAPAETRSAINEAASANFNLFLNLVKNRKK